MKLHVRSSPPWFWLARVGAAVSLILYTLSKIFGPGAGDIEQHSLQPDIIPAPIQQQQSTIQQLNVDDPVWDWNEDNKKPEPVRKNNQHEARELFQAARPRIIPGHEPAWVKKALAAAHERIHRMSEESNHMAQRRPGSNGQGLPDSISDRSQGSNPAVKRFQEPAWVKNTFEVARKRLEEGQTRRQSTPSNGDTLLEEKDNENDNEPMGDEDDSTNAHSQDEVEGEEGEQSQAQVQDDGTEENGDSGEDSNQNSGESSDHGLTNGDEEQTESDSGVSQSDEDGSGGNGDSDQPGIESDEPNTNGDDETQLDSDENAGQDSNSADELNQSEEGSGDSDNRGVQDQEEGSSDYESNQSETESGDSEPLSADEGEQADEETGGGEENEGNESDSADSERSSEINDGSAGSDESESSSQTRDGGESDMADNGSDLNNDNVLSRSTNQQPPSEDDSTTPNEIDVPVEFPTPRRYNVQRLTTLRPSLGKGINPLRLTSRTYVIHRPASCCTVRDPFSFLTTKRTFGSLFARRVDSEEQTYEEGPQAPSSGNRKARLNSANNRLANQMAQSDQSGIPLRGAAAKKKGEIPRNLPWTPVMYRQPNTKVACTRWWDIPFDPRLKPAEKQTCAMEWGIYDSGKFTLEAGLNENRHVVEAQLREKGREAMHMDPHGLVLMQSARLGNYGPIPGFTNLEAALLPGRSRNDGCDITIPFPAILMQRKPFGFNYYHNLVDGIFATFVHQYAYFTAAQATAENADLGVLAPSVKADMEVHHGYQLAGAGSVMGLPQMVVTHDGRDVTKNAMGIDKWWNIIWKRGLVNLFKPGMTRDPYETVPSRVCFKGGVLVGGSFDQFWRAQSLMVDAQQAFARIIHEHYNVTAPATPDLLTVILRRGSRSIINEVAFIRKLRRQVPAGMRVVILRPESTTLKRTVDILARTKVLVAVHGAGLANMLLLPKGAGVFEIAVGGTVQVRGTGQAHCGLVGWEDHPKYLIGRSHYANLAHRLGMPYAMWVPGEKEIRFDDVQSLVESGNHTFHAHAQVKLLLQKGLTYDMMTSWPPKFRQHPELMHVWVSSQSVWVDPIQASSALIGYFKLDDEIGATKAGDDAVDGESE
eukprot:comp24110_c0_seq1/m.43614 comp24110_c0_seq1/g.43614  ORF comp24110_c0_seq1/g.43614 comp24110_c0_seq1/m.43614 type:complete len:1105 (-) comp24110_c0_seq1:196-3510(-)